MRQVGPQLGRGGSVARSDVLIAERELSLCLNARLQGLQLVGHICPPGV